MPRLGLYDGYGTQLPVKAFELHADCLAGNWANRVNREGRLEEGDVHEALDAALAVADFEPNAAGHHGTPEERYEAWNVGFETGDPSACSRYLARGSGRTRRDTRRDRHPRRIARR
jgi:predicted metalloprotease